MSNNAVTWLINVTGCATSLRIVVTRDVTRQRWRSRIPTCQRNSWTDCQRCYRSRIGLRGDHSLYVNGTLTLRAKRQSVRMSKIANDGLTRSGTGCLIAVPMAAVGVSMTSCVCGGVVTWCNRVMWWSCCSHQLTAPAYAACFHLAWPW